MHELAIVESLVAAVEDATRPRRVARVRLEVGALSGVLPEALAFCFELCARDTPLDGAALEIDEIPGRGRCRACGAELTLECSFDLCRCGSAELTVETGQELKVAEVEVHRGRRIWHCARARRAQIGQPCGAPPESRGPTPTSS